MLTKEEIGKRIREYRVKKGKSQAELGKALEHSHAAVSDIETGKTDVSATDLALIAQFLEVPLTELLREESFSAPYIQARDGKNATSEDKKELDASTEAFRQHIRDLAEKEKNPDDK